MPRKPAVSEGALARAYAARRRLRFGRWIAATRLALGRLGCDLRVEADGAPEWEAPPRVMPARYLPPAAVGGRGELHLVLGAGVDLGGATRIEVWPGARNRLALGDGFYMGLHNRIQLYGGAIDFGPGSHIRDYILLKSSGRFSTGPTAILANFCMLHCAQEISFEDRVGVAERVTLIDSDHLVDGSDTYHQDHEVAAAPIHLDSNVWVGANCVLLRGVRVGRNAVVAAGSVVREGEYPGGTIIAGVPAEVRRHLPRSPRR